MWMLRFGGGGHSRAILSKLGNGRLIAFDQDPDARENLTTDERITFVAENFKFIDIALTAREIGPVDGILADLGISSHQIDTPERGFSYRFDAPLDMRMNPKDKLTAADILNTYELDDLVRVFKWYGEVANARKLAGLIEKERQIQAIRFTTQFERLIRTCIPVKRKSKYLSQVYQALRIEVNGELDALESLLRASVKLLKPGGRLAIIAYHSLEDRMVKRFFFGQENFSGKVEKDMFGNPLTPWKLITRKAIQASEEEIEQNPRARSARLRVVEKQNNQ